MDRAEEIFETKSYYNVWLNELTADEKNLILEMLRELSLSIEDKVMPSEVVTGGRIIEEALKHIYPNNLDKYTTKTHYDYMEENQEIIEYIIDNFYLVRKSKPA